MDQKEKQGKDTHLNKPRVNFEDLNLTFLCFYYLNALKSLIVPNSVGGLIVTALFSDGYYFMKIGSGGFKFCDCDFLISVNQIIFFFVFHSVFG